LFHILGFCYLIIPASEVNTRCAEINNIAVWATLNNFTLNVAKTTEIIIMTAERHNNSCRHCCQASPEWTKSPSYSSLTDTVDPLSNTVKPYRNALSLALLPFSLRLNLS